MTGYARAICGDGVDSGNYNRYGTRAIAGVMDSGGPPAIHDITMGKLLAGCNFLDYMVIIDACFGTKPAAADPAVSASFPSPAWAMMPAVPL
jgi:hypothetical protein